MLEKEECRRRVVERGGPCLRFTSIPYCIKTQRDLKTENE